MEREESLSPVTWAPRYPWTAHSPPGSAVPPKPTLSFSSCSGVRPQRWSGEWGKKEPSESGRAACPIGCIAALPSVTISASANVALLFLCLKEMKEQAVTHLEKEKEFNSTKQLWPGRTPPTSYPAAICSVSLLIVWRHPSMVCLPKGFSASL